MSTAPDKLELDLTDWSSWKADPESSDDGQIERYILQCRNEAKLAKWNRIQMTRNNYDCFWGRQDFSHKQPGQSREVLAMQPMAVMQTTAFFQQALVDMGDEWWRCSGKNAFEESLLKIDPDVVQRITQMQLTKAGIVRHAGLGITSAILGGLWITKVTGCQVPAPIFMAERAPKGRAAKLKHAMRRYWQLKFENVSQFNYYPDPTPGLTKLYEIEDMWVDYKDMMAQAEGPDAIYDKAVCERVGHRGDDDAEQKFDQMRRTNQNETSHAFRGRVKITEFWGTILDVNGEVLYENCVATLADDRFLIRKPTPNPNWNQKSPYIATPLLDSPDAVWPKALADAATNYNVVASELWNLMIDGAMRSVNGVAQIRQDWLEDPSQISNGIKPGTNLGVNAQCPPGAHVLEELISGQVPPDSLNMLNLIQQEFNRAMLTSDIRQGVVPKKDVSATQVAQGQQTISSVFQGISKQIEQHHIQKMLEFSWELCCQFSDDMDQQELKALLGSDYDDFRRLTPEERFAATVGGIHYDVFGISLQMQKSEDYRKIMTMLQTIGASEPMTEAFIKRFSFDETLAYAMRALGLPIRQLELSHEEQEHMKEASEQQPQAPAGGTPMASVPSASGGGQAAQLGSAAAPFGNTPTGGGGH